MTKGILFTLSGILCVIGLCIAFVGMLNLGFDFNQLNMSQSKQTEYEITDSFENINIDLLTSDVIFVESQDGKCKVVCDEREKLEHYVTVNNGTLEITQKDTRKWYDYIGIFLDDVKVTIYLPEENYTSASITVTTGAIKINSEFYIKNIVANATTGNIVINKIHSDNIKLSVTTGNISLQNTTVQENVELKTTTGKINCNNVNCYSLKSKCSTGTIDFADTLVYDELIAENGTGDINLNKVDMKHGKLSTSTGDVKGSLLSPKQFDARSTTGKVNVPVSEGIHQCEIRAVTGDINISIYKE